MHKSMRKFRIKNAPKRRYVRRHAVSTSGAFSRSLISGLTPSLLIAIALLATLIISLRPVDDSTNFTYRFVFPYKHITDALLTVFTAIMQHKITLTFSLPQIDIKQLMLSLSAIPG